LRLLLRSSCVSFSSFTQTRHHHRLLPVPLSEIQSKQPAPGRSFSSDSIATSIDPLAAWGDKLGMERSQDPKSPASENCQHYFNFRTFDCSRSGIFLRENFASCQGAGTAGGAREEQLQLLLQQNYWGSTSTSCSPICLCNLQLKVTLR